MRTVTQFVQLTFFENKFPGDIFSILKYVVGKVKTFAPSLSPINFLNHQNRNLLAPNHSTGVLEASPGSLIQDPLTPPTASLLTGMLNKFVSCIGCVMGSLVYKSLSLRYEQC